MIRWLIETMISVPAMKPTMSPSFTFNFFVSSLIDRSFDDDDDDGKYRSEAEEQERERTRRNKEEEVTNSLPSKRLIAPSACSFFIINFSASLK